jgi:hypothetical protein
MQGEETEGAAELGEARLGRKTTRRPPTEVASVTFARGKDHELI